MAKPVKGTGQKRTAVASSRKGRGAPRSPKDPRAQFNYFVALPTVLVYVTICVLVLATLHLMTGEINRIDGDRTRKAIGAALDSFVLRLGEQVADEATWTEAYLNTYIQFNPAWLDGTWGSTARTNGHYDTAIMSDAKGEVLFGESIRGPLTGDVSDHFSGSVELLEKLAAVIARAGDDGVVAELARTGETGISAVAAAVVHGVGGQVTVPAADRRILWLAKTIEDPLLSEMAHMFQVPVPRLTIGMQPMPEHELMALRDAAGAEIGQLLWRPLRPGDAAFNHTASIASVILLIVGVLIFSVITAFRRSVERRAEADERDWVSARYDPSTGLLNRLGLEESIASLVPKKNGELTIAVARVEFEGVKDVIGSYGQQTAEALLDRIADLIDAGIDGQAQIARIGPDEFALVRAGGDAGQMIRKFARTVLELVAEAIPLNDLRLKLRASIGVAEAVVTAKTAGDALTMAGAALQRALETGGNHVVEYQPSLEESRQQRIALQADIRRGLDAGEFDLVYQPIFDFGSETMLGVEALLRWPRRPGGAMSPAEFIPAAETSGLIEELGLYALRRACRDMAGFPHLKLSVNVSTVQFRSPTLTSQIDSIINSAGFPPARLQLEITESFLLTQPERAKTAIEELRGLGISIALDDFGTGFSSVGYLRQFRFDRVKLDRSLVEDVDVDPLKCALVESTMLIAFAMDLAVTAEGVERREEAAMLTRLGCREFQGYLFSRPLTLEGLGRLIRPAEMEPLKQAG